MKVITPRAAHLSNHEVLSHLQSLRAKYTHTNLSHGSARALKAGNLETVMHEVSSYLTSLPNHDPRTWPLLDDGNGFALQTEPSTTTTTESTPTTIQLKSLEKRISSFLSSLPHHIHFEKPELLMMINNRPESQAELYLVVEDVETRMSEEDQSSVLDCVKRFWGGKWGEEEEEGQEGEGGYDDGEGGADEEMEE